jgi:tetratricopeptide (TPR) repeat protein
MVIPGPFPTELTLFTRAAATSDSRLPEGDVMRKMAVSQDPQASRISAAVRASILILGILACRPLHAGSDPTREASPADLSVRAMVLLKDPGTALRDGDRQFPNRGERLFRVERLGGGFADIATEDGTIRGWVEVDQLLTLGKAAEQLDRKIAADPNDAQAYLLRGRIWIEKEEWDRALADLDAAIRLAPADAKSHHLRGLVQARKNQIDQAIVEFSEAIRLDPGLAVAYRDRGLAWDAKRDFDKALPDLNDAIRLDPGNVSFVMSRGKVCSTRGRHNQAMADFAWVIRARPGDPAGYVARGEELLEDLQSLEAIADFTRALEVDPTFDQALLLRAKAWRRRFDYARAIDDYAEAIRRATDNPVPRQALAWILATCPDRAFRDGPRGVQEGTMACELTHWKSPECLDALAAAYAEAGDYESAVKWQARAVGLLPMGDKTRAIYRRRMFIYEARHPYRD